MVQGDPVCDALGVGGKARVLGQIWRTQNRITKPMPFGIGLHRHHQGAIGADHRSIRADHGMVQPMTRGLAPGLFHMQQRHRHPVGHDIEHGDVDMAATPCDATGNQRFEHGGICGHAGGNIGCRDADLASLLGSPGQPCNATFGLHQHVIGAVAGIRGVLSVAANIGHDQPGKARRQCGAVQSHPR